MDFVIAGLAEHGYIVLFGVVFLEAVGLPIPAALALLLAGGATARHLLHPAVALGGSVAAILVADTCMFLLGRSTGWWLLGLLCRISLNPEGCILRSADMFYRRGRALLVVAKFIPGINTLAPPLAGSMNLPFLSFLRLDVLGAVLYAGVYFGVGYLFSNVLGEITSGYQTFGEVIGWVFAGLLVAYAAMLVWTWTKARSQLRVPLIDPTEAAKQISAHDAVVYDVRSHGYYDAKAERIQGSRRLDPNALHQPHEALPLDRPVYLYCTCIREATSARVARELMAQGVKVAVIKGGLRDWRKSGLPIEAVPEEEMTRLPSFV